MAKNNGAADLKIDRERYLIKSDTVNGVESLYLKMVFIGTIYCLNAAWKVEIKLKDLLSRIKLLTT